MTVEMRKWTKANNKFYSTFTPVQTHQHLEYDLAMGSLSKDKNIFFI